MLPLIIIFFNKQLTIARFKGGRASCTGPFTQGLSKACHMGIDPMCMYLYRHCADSTTL